VSDNNSHILKDQSQISETSSGDRMSIVITLLAVFGRYFATVYCS